MCQDIPSPHIDAAICDLLTKVQNFSDSYIDIPCVHLMEKELEQLVVKLIVQLTKELKGNLLAEMISQIRDGKGLFEDSI